ncbi:MAG: sigma-70 family RNA polymerase sigma factor [Myxococcota bacterium]
MTTSDDTSPEALGRRHWAEIKAWALYECGDLSTADDVCQEAWMKLRASRTALDPTRNPLAWLRTVVRSTARDLLARESRMRRPAPVERSTTPDLDRVIDLHRGAREALDAFAALSPRQREAVDLVDRQGLTVSEAADRMEVEPGTVRVLVHQARKALRARLLDTELPALVRSR